MYKFLICVYIHVYFVLLDPLKKPHKLELDQAFVDVKQLVDHMSKNWNMTCITDVIWNQTSCDSQWLQDNPDAAYNLVNSPYLQPAYALDVALKQFSDEIADGKWIHKGINTSITSEQDINVIASCLMELVLPSAKYLHALEHKITTEQLQKAVDNLVATLHYEFLDPKGPQRQDITKTQPLFSR